MCGRYYSTVIGSSIENREVGPERSTRHKENSLSGDPVLPSSEVAPAFLRPKAQVLTRSDIERAIKRISHEITERNRGSKEVVLLGLATGGVWIAELISAQLLEIDGFSPPTAELDVSLFRDDRPRLESGDGPSLKLGITDRVVVLVDDVLYTGRTVRAALEALGALGRPKAIQLAVLVDRGHRELPIRPDFVGKNLPTSKAEFVEVGPKGVLILEEMREGI